MELYSKEKLLIAIDYVEKSIKSTEEHLRLLQNKKLELDKAYQNFHDQEELSNIDFDEHFYAS